MSSRKIRKKLYEKDYRDAFLESHVRSRIAYQIQALRAQLGMSQKEFADKIGKPQSVVSRLEDTGYGKVTVQTLLDIAHALDIALQVRFCDFSEFLSATEDTSPRALEVRTFSEDLKEPEAVLKTAVENVGQSARWADNVNGLHPTTRNAGGTSWPSQKIVLNLTSQRSGFAGRDTLNTMSTGLASMSPRST